jgi:hypothetical protein
MEIVIDKSFLQGAPGDVVRRLCDEHTVLLTETLFYELLTAAQHERDACFAKLPDRDNPVVLIPRPGPLFRHEIEELRGASPVANHRIPVTFRFNPNLRRRCFQHPADEQAALADWRRETEEEVGTFHKVATGVSAWCPSLTTVSGERLRVACEDLKRQACADTTVVRRVYLTLGLEGFPHASFLGSGWALFRWVQAHLLCSLDYVARYGFGDLARIPKRVEHDIHDIQYLLYGALCGALATRDSEIAANFSLARPDGTLIQ